MGILEDYARQAPDLSHETALETRERLTAEKARRWRLLCEAGKCRYRAAPAHEEPRHHDDDGEKCGGYVGIKRDEWKWTICPWHQDWWNRRRAYLKSQKATTTTKKTGYEE